MSIVLAREMQPMEPEVSMFVGWSARVLRCSLLIAIFGAGSVGSSARADAPRDRGYDVAVPKRAPHPHTDALRDAQGHPLFWDSNRQLVRRDGYPGMKSHAMANVESIVTYPHKLASKPVSPTNKSALDQRPVVIGRSNGRPLMRDSNGEVVFADGYPGARPHAMTEVQPAPLHLPIWYQAKSADR